MADESGLNGPAIAETTSQVEATEPDGKVVEAVEPEPAPGGEKPPEPAKDKLQERFDRITREKYDALRRADQLEYEVQRLREQTQAKAEPVAPVTTPTLESVGGDWDKYQAAIVEFAKAEAKAAAQAEFQTHLKQQAEKAKASEFDKRQAEFAATTPDYWEKVGDPSIRGSEAVKAAITESDVGAQLSYYLATHRDELAEINAMSARAADRQLWRIEEKLLAEKTKPPKPPVSQAPPPPPKLEAAEPDARIELDSPEAEKLSDAEWTRRRNLQEKRRRENRNRA